MPAIFFTGAFAAKPSPDTRATLEAEIANISKEQVQPQIYKKIYFPLTFPSDRSVGTAALRLKKDGLRPIISFAFWGKHFDRMVCPGAMRDIDALPQKLPETKRIVEAALLAKFCIDIFAEQSSIYDANDTIDQKASRIILVWWDFMVPSQWRSYDFGQPEKPEDGEAILYEAILGEEFIDPADRADYLRNQTLSAKQKVDMIRQKNRRLALTLHQEQQELMRVKRLLKGLSVHAADSEDGEVPFIFSTGEQ